MNMQHLNEEEEDKTILEEAENVGSGYNTISNRDTSEFLRELNLVLILSFLSLSAEERLDHQAIKPKNLIKHPNSKGSDSTLHVYKRESKVNEFRAFERQTHKFQTKIRDCRYDFPGSWLSTRSQRLAENIASLFPNALQALKANVTIEQAPPVGSVGGRLSFLRGRAKIKVSSHIFPQLFLPDRFVTRDTGL